MCHSSTRSFSLMSLDTSSNRSHLPAPSTVLSMTPRKKNLVSVWFNIQHLDAHSETAHVYFHTQGGVDSESCSINQTIYEIYKSDFLQWVQKKLGQNYLNQQQKTWLTL